MSRIHVEAERTMAASPADVYTSLADYQRKHQQMLPPDHFRDFTVEQGGRGDGTVVSFKLKAGGRERPFRMRVSEVERGRILQEIDTSSSTVTTFHVDPVAEGQRSRVRIVTEWEGAKGIGGFFERTFAPGALRRIYDTELSRLEAVAGE
jgi:uncharacterized protein YndB with AHSA1/START domain